MSIISLIDALRMQKKFYIAASEYPLPCVLCAMKKRRLASGRRRDFMLAEIEPPIPASTFAGIAPAVTNDVRQLILAARFEGTSLFPIQEWPCYVHVLVPCFNTDGVRKFEMKDAYRWIWAELYRTKEDAEKGNQRI